MYGASAYGSDITRARRKEVDIDGRANYADDAGAAVQACVHSNGSRLLHTLLYFDHVSLCQSDVTSAVSIVVTSGRHVTIILLLPRLVLTVFRPIFS